MTTITVYGQPAPQGSKRAFAGKSGRAHVIESSHDRVKSWRQAVIDAVGGLPPAEPFLGPLSLSMVFYLPRPKSHYRTGRFAGQLKPGAPRHPSGVPDLSKLARSTEDALTAVGMWADDAQVAEYRPLAKRWADGRPPGADITVRPAGERTSP